MLCLNDVRILFPKKRFQIVVKAAELDRFDLPAQNRMITVLMQDASQHGRVVFLRSTPIRTIPTPEIFQCCQARFGAGRSSSQDPF